MEKNRPQPPTPNLHTWLSSLPYCLWYNVVPLLQTLASKNKNIDALTLELETAKMHLASMKVSIPVFSFFFFFFFFYPSSLFRFSPFFSSSSFLTLRRLLPLAHPLYPSYLTVLVYFFAPTCTHTHMHTLSHMPILILILTHLPPSLPSLPPAVGTC